MIIAVNSTALYFDPIAVGQVIGLDHPRLPSSVAIKVRRHACDNVQMIASTSALSRSVT